MTRVTWDSRLSAVVGSSASKIEKAFGYRTVGDLLRHYPRRYVGKGSVSELDELRLDEHITFVARVLRVTQRAYPDRRRGGMAYRLEVVVVSDGSTDRTCEIASGFSGRGVILRHYPGRLGKTACLNRAVPLASGDIVVF